MQGREDRDTLIMWYQDAKNDKTQNEIDNHASRAENVVMARVAADRLIGSSMWRFRLDGVLELWFQHFLQCFDGYTGIDPIWGGLCLHCLCTESLSIYLYVLSLLCLCWDDSCEGSRLRCGERQRKNISPSLVITPTSPENHDLF
jgi:hypothetical protein